jgi:hypothetical protein
MNLAKSPLTKLSGRRERENRFSACGRGERAGENERPLRNGDGDEGVADSSTTASLHQVAVARLSLAQPHGHAGARSSSQRCPRRCHGASGEGRQIGDKLVPSLRTGRALTDTEDVLLAS